MPAPSSRTATIATGPSNQRGELDARRRPAAELQGVGGEVRDDLLDAAAVAGRRHRGAAAGRHEADAALDRDRQQRGGDGGRASATENGSDLERRACRTRAATARGGRRRARPSSRRSPGCARGIRARRPGRRPDRRGSARDSRDSPVSGVRSSWATVETNVARSDRRAPERRRAPVPWRAAR